MKKVFRRSHEITARAVEAFRERVAPLPPATVRLTLEGVVQMGREVAPKQFAGQFRDRPYVVVMRRGEANRLVVAAVYVPAEPEREAVS